ncbi:MAG: glycosyltransferase family 2 protein [Planctomycetes bacterium]|nr:glycosyltransferase family 2 protein [Planctomycetota bacterium]
MSDVAPRFTLVVPIFDEAENVGPLLDEVADVLAGVTPFEVILVDDKSRDDSVARILAWKTAHAADWLRLVCMERNGGQSAAVLAGAMHARGPFVMTMDGDRQNDPRDLPRMLELLERGEVDGVTGIRAKRRDTFVRRVSSRIGNGVRNWLTGDRVADSGCGIKGYRTELFLAVPRFNGMHRFMATLVRFCGGKVVEIEVNHRPRVAGQAKYGIGNRAWRGLKDCFAIRWLKQRVILPRAQERRA